MMHSHSNSRAFTAEEKEVLILVVMDDALARQSQGSIYSSIIVLILVVMDDALAHSSLGEGELVDLS